MSSAIPSRFTQRWWLVLLSVTAVVTAACLVWFVIAEDLEPGYLLLVWLGLTLVSDLIAAFAMEAVAPSRVIAGPGDRRFDRDGVEELAVVLSGFEDSAAGSVRLRGEAWSARLTGSGATGLRIGSMVNVIDRDGLTLLVAPVSPGP